jgi:hypothetical protein
VETSQSEKLQSAHISIFPPQNHEYIIPQRLYMKHKKEQVSIEKKMHNFYPVKVNIIILLAALFHMKMFQIFKELVRFLPDGRHLQEISGIYQIWNLK